MPDPAQSVVPEHPAEPQAAEPAHRPHNVADPHGRQLMFLALSALGVVYGDIGTSPLYALKECFNGPHGVQATPQNVMGILSLVFWAMTFVVTFKYLAFVMRADNRGEGGILALMALVSQTETTQRGRRSLIILALFGAALLYGDGVITPAVSVLGAVEGLKIASPAFGNWVVPMTLVILVGLFWVQKGGTAKVGRIFGPLMLVWFACIGVIGAGGIIGNPQILGAMWPGHAVTFFREHGLHGFLVLGSVVLVITGGEALYADMGHFGRKPIRAAWLSIAMPALVLNYFGQGAVLLSKPEAAANPFFLVVPQWFLYPMIAIATVAAIIASQALISGAFSLTSQAVQLGYCPRVTIRHTSSTAFGQIYSPEVNWGIGIACIALVLGFRSTDALAAAYGIAVTGTMIITTCLFHRVARDQWHWSRAKAWPLTVAFLIVDASFFLANVVKIEEGGWLPIAAGIAVFVLMSTWKRGRDALAAQLRDAGLPAALFLPDIERKKPPRVPGTAIFMTSNAGNVPGVLLHHLKHNKVLHERVILASVVTEEIPAVSPMDRAQVEALGAGFWRVTAHYGFMEMPDIPALMTSIPASQLGGSKVKPMETSYYLGRETLLPGGPAAMAPWRKRLFIFMARNAQTASAFFGLPANRVVEMGAQIHL